MRIEWATIHGSRWLRIGAIVTAIIAAPIAFGASGSFGQGTACAQEGDDGGQGCCLKWSAICDSNGENIMGYENKSWWQIINGCP